MNQEILACSYTNVPGFPEGSAIANIVATVTGTLPGNTTPVVQKGAPDDSAFTFPGLPFDTYTYSVAGVDAAGNVFGTPVTGSFTLVAPVTVSLSLPSAVTATQS